MHPWEFGFLSLRLDEVKQLVLLVKVAYFDDQSQPRAKVKQVVLLYQVTTFRYVRVELCLASSAWRTRKVPHGYLLSSLHHDLELRPSSFTFG